MSGRLEAARHHWNQDGGRGAARTSSSGRWSGTSKVTAPARAKALEGASSAATGARGKGAPDRGTALRRLEGL